MSRQTHVHQDIRTRHWVVACTDHGLLWDCLGRRDADDLVRSHEVSHHGATW